MTKNSATGSVVASLQAADLATNRMIHPYTGGTDISEDYSIVP
jgi:hypothetical protein